MSGPEFQYIQIKLNTDQIGDTGGLKSCYIESATRKQTYINAAAARVTATLYYYTARSDCSSTPGTLYTAGFSTDGTIPGTDVSATPYMSSDFCQFFRITRTVTRVLEQGEHIVVNLRRGFHKADSDRYNRNAVTRGSVGCIAKFVGTLGVGTVAPSTTGIVSTAPVSIIYNTETRFAFRQMADNSQYNYLQTAMPVLSTSQVANSDTGTAITAGSGDMIG